MDKLVFSGKEIAPELMDVLTYGGNISVAVTGTSMSPYLKCERDIVHLRVCKDEDIKAGQILLFTRPDKTLVLHRVRKILRNGDIVLNGDGQSWCETITKDQIVAVSYCIERKGHCVDCNSMGFKLWNILWSPTRPIRSILQKIRYLYTTRNMLK